MDSKQDQENWGFREQDNNTPVSSCVHQYSLRQGVSRRVRFNLLAFGGGNAYSWSSSVLITLKSEDPSKNPLGRPTTPSEESWIASLLSLGAACGPVLAGYCSDKIGRKRTLLMFAIPMLLSHLICAFANTPWHFYVARFVLGLGVGALYTVVPIYVGEISETNMRGFLGSFLGVFASLGVLFVMAVGPFVNIMILSFLLTIPLVMFLVIFGLFIPESPYYYVGVDKNTAAEISLIKLGRSDSSSCWKDLEEIKKSVEESMKVKQSIWGSLKCKAFRRGMTITITLMLAQQLGGIVVIISYLENIFLASGSSISPSISTIIVAIIQVCVVSASSYLIDQWGRKLLLLVSCAGCTLAHLTIGIYFYLKNTGSDVSFLWWLPITAVLSYFIAFNFGLGTIPWALVGELFSSNTKALASTVTATTCLSLGFIMTLVFPYMKTEVGYQGVFWFFAGSSLKCFLFVLWYLPETKGKTFQEILAILGK